MKKYLFTFFIFIFLFDSAISQGLIFDSAQFASRASVRITRGPKPKSFSLKKYTPLVYPQVGSTCVAHSFATARTILAAKSLGWTDKQKITSIYFSPYYIYYRNKSDNDIGCNAGLNIEVAAKDVLQNGFAPIVDVEYPNYYPFTGQALCIEKNGVSYPPTMQEDQDAAANYKIDDIYTVTTLQQLKTALSSGMPVAVIMYPPPSFSKVKTDLWAPPITEKVDKTIMAHAVLAIGYDDIKYGGSVEIMNSWGDTWGNKGFVSVKYKDYLKFFLGGYAFYMRDNAPSAKKNIPGIKDSAPQKVIDGSSGALAPSTINVKTGYENGTVKFNNSELLKAFKK